MSAVTKRNIDAVRDSVGRSPKIHLDDAVNCGESKTFVYILNKSK